MKKILIISDCMLDKVFIQTLENRLSAKIDSYFIDTTDERRKRQLMRHVSYLFMAVRAFLRADDYDAIIFWQQFIGFYFAMIAKCVFWKKRLPATITLPLIYRARKGFVGKIYKSCFSLILNLNVIDRFICHSAGERDFYLTEFGQRKNEKISFIKYGTGMPEYYHTDLVHGNMERYFFAGGTSNRDYRTLLDAFGDLPEKLKIACFPSDLKRLEIPNNVRALYGVYRGDFLSYMKNAYAVIITLDDVRVSSGQLVLLEAMRLGKAIIATRCYSMTDYVDDTCAIFINPHSSDDLKNAIGYLISNQKALNNLAEEARVRYERSFTIKNYAERVVDILEQIRL